MKVALNVFVHATNGMSIQLIPETEFEASFLKAFAQSDAKFEGAGHPGKAEKWSCLLTYADQAHGHTGQIYKATNWEYRGQTAQETSWIDGHGRLVSRKAGPITRTREQMLAMGYTSASNQPKHRFRMILK
jgi:hypothetical protein